MIRLILATLLAAAALSNADAAVSTETAGVGVITSSNVYDDRAWAGIPVVSDFKTVVKSGTPPPRTSCALARSEASLFVRCIAYQNMSTVEDGVMDSKAQQGDYIAVALTVDTNPKSIKQFVFYENPRGDRFSMGNAEIHLGDWGGRVISMADSWIATFAIPFKSLGAPGNWSTWKVGVLRTITDSVPVVWPYVVGVDPLSPQASAALVDANKR